MHVPGRFHDKKRHDPTDAPGMDGTVHSAGAVLAPGTCWRRWASWLSRLTRRGPPAPPRPSASGTGSSMSGTSCAPPLDRGFLVVGLAGVFTAGMVPGEASTAPGRAGVSSTSVVTPGGSDGISGPGSIRFDGITGEVSGLSRSWCSSKSLPFKDSRKVARADQPSFFVVLSRSLAPAFQWTDFVSFWITVSSCRQRSRIRDVHRW